MPWNDPQNRKRTFIGYSVSAPGAVSIPFFFGPKAFDTLKAVDVELVRTIDFGMFAVLVVPLLRALEWINNYVGNFGVSEPGVDGEGVFFRGSEIAFRDITDGLSTTFLAGERSFRYAEATWVGAVSEAQQVPTPSSPMAFQINNASNFVLAHTGESFDGAHGATEINNFTSRHGRGGNYLFADAHVSLLGDETDYATFKALSTRSKGEIVQGDR